MQSINEKLVHSLWDVNHRMRSLHDGKASQGRILVILHERGAMTQKAMTEHLHIQPGSASEVLAKLENSGLITRTPNQEDRRTTMVVLTEAGELQGAKAMEQRRELHREMFASLTETEKDTLYALLEQVKADWDQRLAGDRSRGKE